MTRPNRWQQIARRIRVPLGFVFAAVFLLLAHPSPRSLALSLLLVVPGLALRAYSSGYVQKNAELATSGPYSYTRNPLYLGSAVAALGFALAARGWILPVLLIALFALIYIPTIRSEEIFLRDRFPAFDLYSRTVPRFFPRVWPASASSAAGRFSPSLYRKHREYNSLIGAVAIYAALLLRLFLPGHR